MALEDTHKPSLTISAPTRRDVLKRMLATVGGSIAAGLSTQGSAYAAATSDHHKCPLITGPMHDLSGKVAFVTGGSSGIGLGIARAFVDAGMRVVITYRTSSHLESAMKALESAGDRVHSINVDVTDRPGMEKAADETVQVFGKVHVLVNNAGVSAVGPLSKATYHDWDWIMGVNLTGVFNGIHAFLPRIQAHGEGGQIVTTSSVNGLIAATDMVIYSASKAAVINLTEGLRGELAGQNIGVSVFCPGVVNTDIIHGSRNRPSALSDTGDKLDPKAMKERDNEWTNALAQAMDPVEAGTIVLRGIRNNDLYILSHPEFEQGVKEREEALIASMPRGPAASQGRLLIEDDILRNPVFAAERDRKRCTAPRGKRGTT